MPLPGSCNQGSQLESLSNPPSQLRPRHAQVPLMPRAGLSFWASHSPHVHRGLAQSPREDRTSLIWSPREMM